MKRNFLFGSLLILITICGEAFAQDKQRASDATNFSIVRKNDFIRLIGTESGFQGFSIKYDKDKTVLTGSGGHDLNSKGTQMLFFNASLGTSTNLSSLFNQETLPVISVGISYNIQVRKIGHFMLTKYFYDGELSDNIAGVKRLNKEIDYRNQSKRFQKCLKLNDTAFVCDTNVMVASSDLDAFNNSISTNSSLFTYREKLKKQIANGTLSDETLYTFKRIFWVSFAAKYNNDHYGFIDYNRPFSVQQYDTGFATMMGQVSINGYMGWNHDDFKWRRRPAYLYFSAYGRVNRANNISDIKKVSVFDVKRNEYDSASNTIRQSGKSQNYYNGNYYEYISASAGLKFWVSPINHLTLEFIAETTGIGSADREKYDLNNYSTLSAGFFVYTGAKDAFKINLGAAIKWLQTSTDKSWNNRVELITSIPITSFN